MSHLRPSAAADHRLLVFSFFLGLLHIRFIEENVLFPSADVSTITIALSSFSNRKRRDQYVVCQPKLTMNQLFVVSERIRP